MMIKDFVREKLPEGKYNGKKVDGFTMTFSFHLLCFHWLPKYGGKYNRAIFWLWFTVRWEANYLPYTDKDHARIKAKHKLKNI